MLHMGVKGTNVIYVCERSSHKKFAAIFILQNFPVHEQKLGGVPSFINNMLS